ncbi:putative lipoprotein [Calothrix sp. NIES-4071]|nr:putative lipoprotein [Calothrix sp. NIES-4071]BAZ59800.1 putative lipoprotein [Calothrix sp. NIES-4105]
MIYDQAEFDITCEWGIHGAHQLAPISSIIIVVDVLSFSTSVEIATNNGATVYPYRYKEEAKAYAESLQAELALKRESGKYSLSPASLQNIPSGTKLVLPSPNGANLTLETGSTLTVAGCLRNCEAVAKFAQKFDRVAVIPAGERWEDDSLRPAFEDLIGAGAILSYLNGTLSPEAQTAIAAFNSCRGDLLNYLRKSSSGKELIYRGYSQDVELAAAFNVSSCVPVFVESAYVNEGI